MMLTLQIAKLLLYLHLKISHLSYVFNECLVALGLSHTTSLTSQPARLASNSLAYSLHSAVLVPRLLMRTPPPPILRIAYIRQILIGYNILHAQVIVTIGVIACLNLLICWLRVFCAISPSLLLTNVSRSITLPCRINISLRIVLLNF